MVYFSIIMVVYFSITIYSLRYDIQCHDVDEYLVYLFDGLLTERPLELLEVVTIDGDLPLEFLFHLSLCKVN